MSWVKNSITSKEVGGKKVSKHAGVVENQRKEMANLLKDFPEGKGLNNKITTKKAYLEYILNKPLTDEDKENIKEQVQLLRKNKAYNFSQLSHIDLLTDQPWGYTQLYNTWRGW